MSDQTKKLHKRRLMSKYDSVKVFVGLPGSPPTSYVLSRYLIARMLTVAQIPHKKSVKIAMRVKKHFVDHDMLDISQAELEVCLYENMKVKSYGQPFVEKLKLVQRFYAEKRPLIMMLCGAPSIGKSSFAQQLAARFNISHVLQADVIYEMLKTNATSPMSARSLFEPPLLQGRAWMREYERECHILRHAIDAELHKVVNEGKVVIMEGLHLDPALYVTQMQQFDCVTFPSSLSDGVQSQQSLSEGHELRTSTLYIPVVVTLSINDHWLLAKEAIHRTGSRFFSAQASAEGGKAVFRKLRELNDHFLECQHPDVIYIRLGLSDITEALDRLHDHFLKCIQFAMQ